MKPRSLGLALVTSFFLIAACSSGGGSGTASSNAGSPNGGGNGSGGPGVNAAAGTTILGPSGAILHIPANALNQNTPISVGNGSNIAFPTGVTMAGPAIEASPAGLKFRSPATIGVPVNVAGLPIGVEPSELRVYAREADGSIQSLPVVGYDDSRRLLYASIMGFTTFQAAVPTFDFAIVPQTIRMGFLQAFYSETLTFSNNTGGVRWELVSTMQIAGETPEPTDPPTAPAPNEILPGLSISSTGTISGFPQDYGTWAFTLRATDSAAGTPHVAEISHTITIASLTWHGVPGTTNVSESILRYDDAGNGFVMIRRGSACELHKLPVGAASGQNITSVNFSGGPQCDLAVAPDGSGVVVVYEAVVTTSMDLYTTNLAQAIISGSDGMVDNLAIDLNGNGTANITVSFPCSATGFTGSDQEIYAFAAAINTALAGIGSPARAIANGVFSGVSIIDNGANLIGVNSTLNLKIRPNGDAPFGVSAAFNAGYDGNHQRIFARQFDGDLMPIGGALRIDGDVTFPEVEEPAAGEEAEVPILDPTLSNISRRAANPGVAFAQDRSVVPTETPEEPEDDEEEPEPLLFFVAYEQIRNMQANGALRSDVYGRWLQFGAGAISDETRLDTTDLAGDSPGQRTVVAGTAAGVQVLWVERGGDNAGTNPAGANNMPSAGSDGDLAAVMLSTPAIPAMDEEGFGEPIEITVPMPTFLNVEATTTALHPVLTVTRMNQIYGAWSERTDTDLTSGPRTLRKDISLRVAEISGSSASGGFLVDDAPLDSLIYATALAVREDGQIAVTWVEDFGTQLKDGFLRRFSAPGTPIENPIEISWNRELNLEWLPDGRLSILARSGGDIARLRVEAEEEVVAETSSEN